jgi:hypothetical protein
MSDNSIIFPGMIKPLRLARVYGFLVELWDGVYRPGGSQRHARRCWRGSWLKVAGSRSTPSATSPPSALG